MIKKITLIAFGNALSFLTQAQLPNIECIANILQNDTTICSGASVQLNAIGECPQSEIGAPEWQLLFPATSYTGSETNFSPSGYDPQTRTWYSVLKTGSINRVYAFNLANLTISNLASIDAPGELYNHAFDRTNNRLVASRVGRDVVYSLPLNGGIWQQIGGGTFDAESYGNHSFWNPLNNRFSYFGGYGFYTTKNWIWENNGDNWINPYPNNNNCNPAKRGWNGGQMAINSNGRKIYIFSGAGSCNGDQYAPSCALGSPWSALVGTYCWLRDLWELDLATYQFTNILPVNNQSITREGAFTFDYSSNTFYNIGGRAPTETWDDYTPYTMEVSKFERDFDQGFSNITVGGTPPPAIGNGTAVYDSIGNRIVYARTDGIWAINLGSSCNLSYLWSNGETTPTIAVSPTQTTTYYCTISNGITTCLDSVTIIVGQPSAETINASINQGESYNFNGQNLTTGGTYIDTLQNAVGCDSVVTLNLNISSIPITCGIQSSSTDLCVNSNLNIELIAIIQGIQQSNNACNINNANTFSSWTHVYNADQATNIIKFNDTYYLRTADDVKASTSITGPYNSLGFASQVNQPQSAELLGFDNLGRLHVATGWECLYYWENDSWNSNGLCGFGTGGQHFTKLDNGRIVISKGGFLRDIYYSDDNGSNWINATNLDVDWNHITKAANGDLFACSAIGGFDTKGVIRSIDNGSSWQYINNTLNNIAGATGITMSCSNDLFVVGDKSLFKSTDNGLTWNEIASLPPFFDTNPIYGDLLLTSSNDLYYSGYISATQFGLFKTSDLGVNWEQITQPAANFGSLVEIDGNIGYFSSEGMWLKSDVSAPQILWSTGETSPSISVSPTETTTYNVTVTQGNQSCTSEVTINVNQAPTVNYEPDLTTFCNNSGSVELSGGAPTGGTYSGPGVENGIFSPTAAGEGLHSIVYSVTNSNGCSNESSALFEVALCTGESDNTSSFASVYPNPIHDVVFVHINSKSSRKPLTLLVSDATGRAVIQKVIHAAHGNFTVDVAHLSHGMYTFILSNDEQLFIKRLVK